MALAKQEGPVVNRPPNPAPPDGRASRAAEAQGRWAAEESVRCCLMLLGRR